MIIIIIMMILITMMMMTILIKIIITNNDDEMIIKPDLLKSHHITKHVGIPLVPASITNRAPSPSYIDLGGPSVLGPLRYPHGQVICG